MKQKLRFQSEQEFQNFFSQLASAEFHDFQAVEGLSGDKGFDGVYDSTAFQSYFPEENNRTDTNFKRKIDEDLQKVLNNSRTLGLDIKEWVFVVPEDLRIDVVAHLIKKTNETGIKCLYWGATKLTELLAKHPHIQESFPTIFLPPVHEGIKDIQQTLDSGIKATMAKSDSPMEIITEHDFTRRRQEIRDELSLKVAPYYFGGRPDRTRIKEIVAFEQEAEDKYRDLQIKKQASDKLYDIELEEIGEKYNEAVENTNEEMNRRGLFYSGIKDRAIGRLEVKKNREIERLKLKYGKTGLITFTDTLFE